MSRKKKQAITESAGQLAAGIENRESSSTSDSIPTTSIRSTPSKSQLERWAFPTVSACPRCRGTSTRATSTQGRVQYRQCQSAICRQRYHVIGTKVPAAAEVPGG